MKRNICVIGTGYVGLPLAVGFDEAGHDVVGFDIDSSVITQLRHNVDPTDDIGTERLADCSVTFTTDETAIERAEYVIITVPTPVDDLKNPNLTYVERAGAMVGEQMQEGATVVLESTVYPGATEEILLPALAEASGLSAGEEFFVGYSPERLVPGDDEHSLESVVKIVSGQTDSVAASLERLYGSVVDAGIHVAPSIEVAEAAKCLENIQRDLNIALVNELAIACNALGLDTTDVLDAAGTKWNFHDYSPGLVGGHCIPVDPFFMIYESKRNGFTPQLIETAREVNEYMPEHVGEQALRVLTTNGKAPSESTALVLGLTYKPNVEDIRTSAVDGVIQKLRSYDVGVVGYDSRADPDDCRAEFGIPMQAELSLADVDVLVLAACHDELRGIDYADAAREMAPNPGIVDVHSQLDRERLSQADHLTYVRV